MSKTKEIVYNGNINEDGALHVVNRKNFDEEIRRFGKAEVEVIIRRKRRTVSSPLRRYYFGVIVKMISVRFKELGSKIELLEADEWVRTLVMNANTETVHAFIKDMFIESVTIDEDTGEIVKTDKSTKRMTNVEFMEFYTPVYQWAAEVLDIQIPEPNEDFTIPDNIDNDHNDE